MSDKEDTTDFETLARALDGKLSPEKIKRVASDLKAAKDVEIALATALRAMSPSPDSAVCITGTAVLLGRMLAVSDSLVKDMPAGMKRMRLTGVLQAVTQAYDMQTDSLAAGKTARSKSEGTA